MFQVKGLKTTVYHAEGIGHCVSLYFND
jgi:hypothetical protein